MPTQAVARHRLHTPARHRAGLGNHGRNVALTVTLGTALIVGIAGGTAAAATTRRHHDVAAVPDPAPVTAQTYLDDVDAVPPEVLREGGADRLAVHREPVFGAGIGAQGVHLKSRPQPKILARPAGGAAWVNPNPSARVTSCFGPRWGRQHEGVDMAAPDGTPIVAAGAGIVVRAGVERGYGNAVLIDHGDGWLTHYGHLSVIGVIAGQRVAAGEQIGNEGSTGHSTGPHLHFEVHQGYYQNPVEPTLWMHLHGVDIPGCAAF